MSFDSSLVEYGYPLEVSVFTSITIVSSFFYFDDLFFLQVGELLVPAPDEDEVVAGETVLDGLLIILVSSM